MGKPLIIVSSITYAMKGRELLLKNGFYTRIVRIPHFKGMDGCGYSLYVPNKTKEAEEFLIKNNVEVLGRANRGDPI